VNTTPLAADLKEAWVKRLRQWWHYYNLEYLNEALRPPVFRLGDGSGKLGHWESATRTLVVSADHIERHLWLAVMDTLRHEMAHQFADEVLRAEGEGPHGPAFREACGRLRCSPRATARQEDLDVGEGETEDDRIVRRLKKLLSLAQSPSEHEAQAAVKKARLLLTRYNIDLVDLDRERRFDVLTVGDVKGRRTSYELWLASILSAFFFVEAIWVHSYDARRDRTGTVLQLFGTKHNLEMAAYVHDYLLRLLDRLWVDYRSHAGLTSNRERQRYFTGAMEGFYRKLDDQQETLVSEQALIWKGDPELTRFRRYHLPRVTSASGGSAARTSAYRDGVAEGRRITLSRPVEKGAGGRRGLLAQPGRK
jgi:hypothetical protein